MSPSVLGGPLVSKSNAFETDSLKLIFNATPIANLADNAAVGPLAGLYLSLHTADPGEAGDQTTNEVSYTGYARAFVARTPAGWVVTGSSVSPAADVSFPASTGGTGGTVTYVGVGTSPAGAGKLLYSGPLTPVVAVATGVTPKVLATSTVTED